MLFIIFQLNTKILPSDWQTFRWCYEPAVTPPMNILVWLRLHVKTMLSMSPLHQKSAMKPYPWYTVKSTHPSQTLSHLNISLPQQYSVATTLRKFATAIPCLPSICYAIEIEFNIYFVLIFFIHVFYLFKLTVTPESYLVFFIQRLFGKTHQNYYKLYSVLLYPIWQCSQPACISTKLILYI